MTLDKFRLPQATRINSILPSRHFNVVGKLQLLIECIYQKLEYKQLCKLDLAQSHVICIRTYFFCPSRTLEVISRLPYFFFFFSASLFLPFFPAAALYVAQSTLSVHLRQRKWVRMPVPSIKLPQGHTSMSIKLMICHGFILVNSLV